MKRVAIIVSIVLAGAALSACSSHDNMGHGPTPSIPAGANFNTADVQFAQMMIVHHQQAVEMSELAKTRAVDVEVTQLAIAIQQAQQPEIDKMTGWLNAWKQPTSAGEHHSMPGLMSEQDMEKLKGLSGTEFDKQFATMMIAHHNGAIQMARDVLKNGSHPDVKALATEIEKTQTDEVAELQQVLDRL